MQKITVVIRVDAGAVIITPEIVESALNTYLAENGNVTVFHAAQQSVHADGACPKCGAEGYVILGDGRKYCNVCKTPRR